jgi:hypothetical protein
MLRHIHGGAPNKGDRPENGQTMHKAVQKPKILVETTDF